MYDITSKETKSQTSRDKNRSLLQELPTRKSTVYVEIESVSQDVEERLHELRQQINLAHARQQHEEEKSDLLTISFGK